MVVDRGRHIPRSRAAQAELAPDPTLGKSRLRPAVAAPGFQLAPALAVILATVQVEHLEALLDQRDGRLEALAIERIGA
ncbi:hypothetical protein D3C85_1280360 [compost metagenome]